LYGSTQYLHVVFFEDSAFIQGDTAVEGRLATEGEQNTLRTFFCDDFLYEKGSYGEEVDMVGHTFRSLYRCDVGIDEDGLYTFFPQRFESLRT